MTLRVTDVPERRRFEIQRDGALLGYSKYQKTDELVVFTHTEVDRTVEGQGVGGQLVRGALDQVRRAGLKVLPVCPFVQAWLLRHPDYADLDYRHPTDQARD
jgi:uncharacterized protein